MTGINSDALDRWITGNYGEDQYKQSCVNCGCIFYNEEEDVCQSCRKKEVKQ